MIIETLITAIADSLVSDGLQSGTKKLRQALGLDSQQLALRRAIGSAIGQFKEAYPEVAASLFDDHFLSHGALPVLERFLQRPRISKRLSQDLADAFNRQLGPTGVLSQQVDMLAVSHDFLAYLAKDLAAESAYYDLFASHDLADTQRSSARIARSVDELRGDVREIRTGVGEIIKPLVRAFDSADAANLPLSIAISPIMAARLGGEARFVDDQGEIYGPPCDDMVFPSFDPCVDRRDDVSWVLNRLSGDVGKRIAALRGMPGIDKTTVAAEVIRQARSQEQFPDGIAVVVCEDASDATAVLSQVLARFDPHRRPPNVATMEDLPAVAELVRARFASKKALVILDHVEPALDIERIVGLLCSAGVAVFVIAQHLLDHDAVPANATRSIGLMHIGDVFEMFVRTLGRDSRAELTLVEQNAAWQIIERLDRHTLAVKLAGAYAADYGRDLTIVAQELHDPAKVLSLPHGEMPQPVARILAKSVASLSPDAVRLFAALAAAGTSDFGRKAALAVDSALGIGETDGTLDQLIRRALLEPSVNENLPAGSERERLKLHPILQAYASMLLDQRSPGDREVACLALARHYAAYLASDEQLLVLETEAPNVEQSLKAVHKGSLRVYALER